MENNNLKISDIIGKPLFAIGDAVISGVVIDIGFDKHLHFAKCLIIDTKEQSDLQKKYVHFRDIANATMDAVVIKHSQNVYPIWATYLTDIYCPYQKSVYNQDGRYIGNLSNIELVKSRVVGIEINDKEFDLKLVHSVSNDAVCVNDSGKKIVIKHKGILSPKAKAPKVQITSASPNSISPNNHLGSQDIQASFAPNDILMASLPDNIYAKYSMSDTVEQAIDSANSNNETTQAIIKKLAQPLSPTPTTFIESANNPTPSMPIHIDSLHTEVTKTPSEATSYEKYYFIKGKTINANIFGNDGKLLFGKGLVIDDAIISTARQNNRLVHLVLYS